ncbi:hypothetical protein E2562_034028 [Oryza meyeriana var. granulata]|uniref:Uncharacterized protein n=1 Tax=Oryza meyeriana var. granulata TaxID=110450 RepID=A0A6G1E535_9ORYZ|nr:hypothetical protein E2562_034028 [Oryza meyeriana var. granulata]
MAAAPAFQPFTIRGFAAGMRAADASKCWPFGGGGDGEPPPSLPPMEPPKRSRWWAHELATERARLESRAAGTEAAGGGVGGGGGSGKGTKRKESRGRVRAERAKKRRRSLQFGLLSKRKEGAKNIGNTASTLEVLEKKEGTPAKKVCSDHDSLERTTAFDPLKERNGPDGVMHSG